MNPYIISGRWEGTYCYDQDELRQSYESGVNFVLQLRQHWWQKLFRSFSGIVDDDPLHGVPGTGRIDGMQRGNTIEFTKRLPVLYVSMDGQLRDANEWLKEQLMDPGYVIPHPPILYRGSFTTESSVAGTWTLPERFIPVADQGLICPKSTGTWTMCRKV